jgi:hypothetical protein
VVAARRSVLFPPGLFLDSVLASGDLRGPRVQPCLVKSTPGIDISNSIPGSENKRPPYPKPWRPPKVPVSDRAADAPPSSEEGSSIVCIYF